MHGFKPIVGSGVVAVLVTLSSPAGAVDNVTVPFIVPRGALVEVNVTSCPVPATASAVARVGPAGGPVEVEVTGDASGGGAELVARVPIDATLGTWTAEVSCLDTNGAVVDGPVTDEFAVVAFDLLTFEPRAGRAGSVVTVSGTGCPPGTTESAFAKIAGASDDPIPLFDPTTPGTALPLTGGGSFSGPLTVPADAPEGENLVWVYCVSEGGEPVAGPIAGTFVVDNSILPPTGRATEGLLLSAAASMLAGLGLSISARRRAG